MRLSFLLVSYNSAALIASSLRAIIGQAAGHDHEILLVDNGDSSTEALVRRDFPQVRVLPGRGNIGYGAGNNYLASQASGDLLVIVNPDVLLVPGTLAALERLADERPDAAAFAGLFLNADGRPGNENFLAPPTLANLLLQLAGLRAVWRRLVLVRQLAEERPVACTSGAFLAIRRAAWDALGGFDESFFLYGEEMDLFARMRARGMILLRSPRLAVRHDTGSGDRHGLDRILFLCRGSMHFARKHQPRPAAALSGAVLWLTVISRLALRPGFRRPAELAGLFAALHPRRWWRGYG